MHAVVAYFTHAILTYARYGRVTGPCVYGPFRMFLEKKKKKCVGGGELKAADVVSPPVNDCEMVHESKASLHFQILVLFPSLLCFSIILFFLRLMRLHRSPMSLPSPHLSIILIPSVLFLSRRNYQIQATQTNDNNNSVKCRRRPGPSLLLPSLPILLPLSSSLASFFFSFPFSQGSY